MSTASSPHPNLQPDRAQLTRFVDALFRHASPGSWIAFRSFFHKPSRGRQTLELHAVPVGACDLVEQAAGVAIRAANAPSPAAFYAPIATFRGPGSAATKDLVDGVALSVECDEDAQRALELLTAVLGPPTIMIASGGLWRDAAGRDWPKLHLHWRLAKPARDKGTWALLAEARSLARQLGRGDPTGDPIVHPLRVAGGWHRKPGKPATRVTIADLRPETEIDLETAVAALRVAVPEPEQRRTDVATTPENLRGEEEDIEAALAAIPNDNLPWDRWTRILMAGVAASEGHAVDAMLKWSAKSEKDDSEVTEEQIEHIKMYPPTRIGFGTLVFEARRADPKWTSPSYKARTATDPTKWWKPPQEPSAISPTEAPVAEPRLDMPIGPGPNVPIISEDEAAIQFAEEHRGKLRFSVAHGKWFVWDGSIWRQNATNLAFTLTRELIRRMAEDWPEKVRIAAGKAAFAGAVERYARADRAFAVTADAWDRDPYLLGTPGGTVDLRTGLLRPARPEDGITKATAVVPAPSADCSLWLRLLDETFGGDAPTIRFFQQWLGYSLTGDTREQCLVFGHGAGGNGKGLTINTVGRIAGTYTVTAAAETFVAAFGSRHSTELAMLAGARIVKASEMEKGQIWAEKRVKELTGGDEITARFMRQDNFTFLPTFKLFIVGNDIPDLNNVDVAMRRRFNLLPFLHTPARVDPALPQKLEAEWPAILRWMINGCLDWQRNGLLRPQCVLVATSDYFADQDTFGQWAEEHCMINRSDENLKEATSRLYASWSTHAKAVGVNAGSEKVFARDLRTRYRLEARDKVPLPAGRRARGFVGIALKAPLTTGAL